MNYIKKNKLTIFLFIISFFSFLLSFFFNENSTGAAISDYGYHKKLSIAFAENFLETLSNYEDFKTRHTPIIPIIFSIFEYFKIPDYVIRFIYQIINLILPVFFYKILSLKYPEVQKSIKIFLVTLIFLSPSFRTLSIWPDGGILGLGIFLLSVFFFIKFNLTKKFKYSIYNVIFLAISSYISPNFSVFSLYFFLKFFQNYKFKKEIFIIISLNIILAIPAFYFVFFQNHDFLFSQKAIYNTSINQFNYFNKIIIIPTIIFFYILPFLITRVIEIKKINTNDIFLTIIIFIPSLFFFDYANNITGGGIFFKFSNYFFKNNFIFYLISYISIIILLNLSKQNYDNLLIIILLIMSNPQLSIYHKYYDPLTLILIFSLISTNINIKKIELIKNKILIFLFFSTFLIISLLKSNFT